MNRGMGHKFLRHVERTKLLLFMVDLHGFQLNKDWPFRNAFETTVLLNKVGNSIEETTNIGEISENINCLCTNYSPRLGNQVFF